MINVLRLVGIVALAVVAIRVYNLVCVLGFHKTIYNQYPGPCRVVPGVDKGSEDITVTSDGLAFISSGLVVPRYIHDPEYLAGNVKGRIFLFDFNHPEKNATDISLKGDFDRDSFYPHGISLYEDPKSGEKRLFVVNHLPTNEDRVELFRFDGKTQSLHHLKTFKGEHMYSLNDVLAIGKESFYFTNDMYFTIGWPRFLESMATLSMGTIGLYEYDQDNIIVSGIHSPNGINMSPDGKVIYLAQPAPGLVTVYERNLKDNSIRQRKVINTYSGLDNIEIDAKTGDLWLGCHPAFHMLIPHFEDRTKHAPSHVLRVRIESKSAPYDSIDIRQVFMDDGALISGSTVARVYDNKLLIGSVVDKLVYCDIKAI